MRFLLDTCIISELAKADPDPRVVSWATRHDEKNFYLSSLTFGELHRGISRLPPSKRREALRQWVEQDLKERFTNRILDVTIQVAKVWGAIQGNAETHGHPMQAMDSLITATGLAHDLTVVTRNTADMRQSGASLLNPWE